MAALHAHLAATRILVPEEHEPAPAKRPPIVVLDSLTLLSSFYNLTEVHAAYPELNQAAVEEDFPVPLLRGRLSEAEITNVRPPSRATHLASGATAQVEFLSDQELRIGHRVSSVETSTIAPLAQRIFRTHFLTDILGQLSNLQKFARSEQAPNYAARLFQAMRLFRDRLPTDPFSAVVLALHDALAFDNNWIRYTGQQYAKAAEILIRFGNQDLNENKALKAIAVLEDIGFDTTPFSLPDEDSAPA